MARIKVKQGRNCRVQMSISTPLWTHYQSNLDMAKKLAVEISFTEEFETWFRRQNEQVTRDLKDLEVSGSDKEARHSDVPTSKELLETLEMSFPAASMAAKTVSGGNSHGND